MEILIQQLAEGAPIQQECAKRTFPRNASSNPPLLELFKTRPELEPEVKEIFRELAENLDLSLDQLLADAEVSKFAPSPVGYKLSFMQN